MEEEDSEEDGEDSPGLSAVYDTTTTIADLDNDSLGLSALYDTTTTTDLDNDSLGLSALYDTTTTTTDLDDDDVLLGITIL